MVTTPIVRGGIVSKLSENEDKQGIGRVDWRNDSQCIS
jgi:hypothetical protein